MVTSMRSSPVSCAFGISELNRASIQRDCASHQCTRQLTIGGPKDKTDGQLSSMGQAADGDFFRATKSSCRIDGDNGVTSPFSVASKRRAPIEPFRHSQPQTRAGLRVDHWALYSPSSPLYGRPVLASFSMLDRLSAAARCGLREGVCMLNRFGRLDPEGRHKRPDASVVVDGGELLLRQSTGSLGR